MTTKGLEEFIKYLKDRTYDLKVRYGRGNTVTVSIFFLKNGETKQVFSNEDRKILSKLAELILMQKPEKVDVEITSNYKKEIHTYKMTNGFVNDNTALPTIFPETQNFGGLGNIEQRSIESIVNKRLEEERKERELEELKGKLIESEKTLNEKTQTITELKSEIESKAEEIDDLQKTIEAKKNFKYYAGITGDILQSFGIKKEIIATPLAGLLTGESEESPKALEESTSEDTSGIVENEQTTIQTENDKRNEMIALISEYLTSVNNKTLSNIFSIFSEIESNPENSDLILEFLNNQ